MGGAISLSANNDTSEHIKRLWRKVSAFEEKPSMKELKYPPHFTFAIYDQEDTQELEAVVHSIFGNTGQVRVTFDKIDHFDASPLVLWASPQDTSVLLALHTAIHKQIDPIGCHEHYRPDTWVPHCTLGTNISDVSRSDALTFANQEFSPFDVIFDTADCISFPPVTIAKRLTLS